MDDLLLALACMAPLAGYLLYTRGQGSQKARYACIGLGLAFCFFALGHFVVTQDLVDMLPRWLPQRELLIYATGCLEALIAFGLFTERWRRLGPSYLWVRVPLQLFLLGWALWPVVWPDAKGRADIEPSGARPRV